MWSSFRVPQERETSTLKRRRATRGADRDKRHGRCFAGVSRWTQACQNCTSNSFDQELDKRSLWMHLADSQYNQTVSKKKGFQANFEEYMPSLPQERKNSIRGYKIVEESGIAYSAKGKDWPTPCHPCTYVAPHLFFWAVWTQPAPTSSFLNQQGRV